jgi:serine/threonine-protein kinase RsbW
MEPSPHTAPPVPFTRTVPARLEEIPPMTEALAEWAEAAGVPPRTMASVSLMVDELVANIVTHGYGATGAGDVRLEACIEDDKLVLLLTDHAFAFDPLQAPPPDTTSSLEDREIGGLGVHFVRRMADEVSYRRTAGTNELRIVKRLASPAPRG